jgi:hypothetical protein
MTDQFSNCKSYLYFIRIFFSKSLGLRQLQPQGLMQHLSTNELIKLVLNTSLFTNKYGNFLIS